MRGSIKRQISVIFIGLVVAILLISLGVNAKFLGQYYILNKQASLTEVYEKLKTASEKGKLTSDSTVEELSEMVEIGNITLAVVSGKEKVRLSIAQNEQKSDELVMQLIGYMLGRNQENGTLLKESDTYQIHSARCAKWVRIYRDVGISGRWKYIYFKKSAGEYSGKCGALE